MKRIAFYLNNKNIPNIDYSDIKKGNPGIGGSEYLCVLFASELSKRNIFDIILLADEDSVFPKHLKWEKCGNLKNAIVKYKSKVDFFIVDSKYFDIQYAKDNVDAKFILRINNTMKWHDMLECVNIPNIIKLVHVGREMYDLYRDARIFPKTTYIYNAVSFEPLNNRTLIPISERKNRVVYIGSIVPNKGFPLLAKVWKEVLKEVPDAELFVIGSGKLYSSSAKLGKYGIAEESLENQFIPYITDDKGNLLTSIHFMGIMGAEKYDIVSQCKVGVPNPGGLSETFGSTAVEMAMMGCYITTKYCPGYIDTVYDNSLLYKNNEKLKDNIVYLLKGNYSQDYDNMISYYKSNFSLDVIIDKWIDLLLSPYEINIERLSPRSNYQMKKLKEWIRKYVPDVIKKYIPTIEHIYRSKFFRTYFKTECPY